MARKSKNKGSWAELFLFVIIIFCFFCILSLFGSPLTGDSGLEWGKYLRRVWGGALIVPLMFVLYLCAAKLLRLRVVRVPRQILGTIMLYVSFAFMLGLLKETGWDSERTIFIPGSFGQGLAKFFVLNIGTFLTLLLVICSFILTAYLFGSRILQLSVPSISLRSLKSLSFRRNSGSRRKQRRGRGEDREYEYERNYPEDRPENILFPFEIPEPKFKGDDEDSIQFSQPKIPDPVFKPEPVKPQVPESEHLEPFRSTISILDNLISSINSGEMDAPGKRKTVKRPARKVRRPLPSVRIPVESDSGNAKSSSKPEAKPEAKTEAKSHNEPPIAMFGPKQPLETGKNLMRDLEKQGRAVVAALKTFGVSASVANIVNGPCVTQYQLELAPGTKVNKILELSEDLAMSLAVVSVRIEAPIVGTHYAGVEIPSPERKVVSLRNILESFEYLNYPARLPLAIGIQSNGKNFVQGLDELPHLLIAGKAGSGKSSFINSCIMSMCSKRAPEDLRLIMIDTRHSEFSLYENLPHLLAAPVSDVRNALKALGWALNEAESRCQKFLNDKVKDLAAYNRKHPKDKRLPEIVIIINETADLMYPERNETENLIVRLAQKAGAAGIHMMLATQTPAKEIITGPIKSNIAAKAVFTLSSVNEAENILDEYGPELVKLTGKGDMLFKSSGVPQAVRVQAAFIGEEKVSEIVDYLAANFKSPGMIKF